jgi:hypothetical protein
MRIYWPSSYNTCLIVRWIFEIPATGFETAEIDLILAPAQDDGDLEADSYFPDIAQIPITRPDDLWYIGERNRTNVWTYPA